MKICVLGAGVIGVTTAYALARLGHDVRVIEKGDSVATGVSHANGAQLSYSHIDPFANPRILKKLPGYLLGTDPAIRIGLSLQPDYLKWGFKFLTQCTSSNYARNLKSRTELANLSREMLAIYENEILPFKLNRTGTGKMVLAQTQAQLNQIKTTASHRSDLKFMSGEECAETEPALNSWSHPIYGGLYAAQDTALDTVLYCKALQRAGEKEFGVQYSFNENILAIDADKGAVRSVKTDKKVYECDRVIVCLGNGSNELLKPLGFKVPIYPMQGYSVTLPLSDAAPTASITDLKNKMVYANLGKSLRIAGFLDANQSPQKAKARGLQLLEIAQRNWPGIADYMGPVQHWTDFRPMVPSGVPIIGDTAIEGLYLNVGHGSLGYTFAAGSASKLAQQIGHARPNTKTVKAEKNYAAQ